MTVLFWCMTLTPRSAGLHIAVIKVSDWAVCEITTSINVDTGGGTCLCHWGHLRWLAEITGTVTGTLHEQWKMNDHNSGCKSTEVDVWEVWPTSLGNTFPFPFRSTCWTGVPCNRGRGHVRNIHTNIHTQYCLQYKEQYKWTYLRVASLLTPTGWDEWHKVSLLLFSQCFAPYFSWFAVSFIFLNK